MDQKKQKKILLLDDDGDLVAQLQAKLEAKGYAVFKGLQGLAAIGAEGSGMPDLILLDALISGVNAYEFFKGLKQDKELSKTPVLVMTTRHGLRDTYEKLGCDEFVRKPVDVGVLVTKAIDLISKYMLIFEPEKSSQEDMIKTFSKYFDDLKFVPTEKEFFSQLKEKCFRWGVCPARLIKDSPADFFDKLKAASKYPKTGVVIHYIEESGENEAIDTLGIERTQLKWHMAGPFLYYDSRLEERPLGKFFVENAASVFERDKEKGLIKGGLKK